MNARLVGQISGPIFAVCGPKYTELSWPVRQCPQFAAPFPIDDISLRSGDIRDQVAKLCEIAPKFDVFGPPNFAGRGHTSTFLTEFYKSGSPSNMWQSLETIGQATSEIRRRKKKKEE